jgi:hypothetical protein
MTGKAGKSGRPKGSGAGLNVQIGLRLAPEALEALEQVAQEQGSTATAVARDIIDRWAKRRAQKGPKR